MSLWGAVSSSAPGRPCGITPPTSRTGGCCRRRCRIDCACHHARRDRGPGRGRRDSQVIGGLETIRSEARSREFEFSESDEDVHSAVERRLVELVGEPRASCTLPDPATTRWRSTCGFISGAPPASDIEQLHAFALALADIAESHAETVGPVLHPSPTGPAEHPRSSSTRLRLDGV